MIKVVKRNTALVWTVYSYWKRKGRGEDIASNTSLSFLSSLAPQIPWLWAWVNSYRRCGRSDPALYKFFSIPRPDKDCFLSTLRNVGWCTTGSSIWEQQTPRCPFQLSLIANRVTMSRARSHGSSTLSLCMLIIGFTRLNCASAEEMKGAWGLNREEWSVEDQKVQK